jgi:hypothetical protein
VVDIHTTFTDILSILVDTGNMNQRVTKLRSILATIENPDYSILYKLLYDNVDKYTTTDTIASVILHIAEGVRWDTHVINKEINFCSTIINILLTTK